MGCSHRHHEWCGMWVVVVSYIVSAGAVLKKGGGFFSRTARCFCLLGFRLVGGW